MRDCPRAPVAQRVGVRSGVCFPLLDGGRVVGTMDFFSLVTALADIERIVERINETQAVIGGVLTEQSAVTRDILSQ